MKNNVYYLDDYRTEEPEYETLTMEKIDQMDVSELEELLEFLQEVRADIEREE